MIHSGPRVASERVLTFRLSFPVWLLLELPELRPTRRRSRPRPRPGSSGSPDIRHVYIRPRTLHLNGKVERSHRVDDQEFYQLLHKDGISDNIAVQPQASGVGRLLRLPSAAWRPGRPDPVRATDGKINRQSVAEVLRTYNLKVAPRERLFAAAPLIPRLARDHRRGRSGVQPGLRPGCRTRLFVCGSSNWHVRRPVEACVIDHLKVAPRERFELPTNGLTVRRSTTELPGNAQEARDCREAGPASQGSF